MPGPAVWFRRLERASGWATCELELVAIEGPIEAWGACSAGAQAGRLWSRFLPPHFLWTDTHQLLPDGSPDFTSGLTPRKEWESPLASLIEKDPEVVPGVDVAAHVGRDFFLDEKIPRHASGQGYVRVVEHSVRWKETAAAKIFTYQGLTTCTEVDKSWTIMSSAYSHVRQGGKKDASELETLIRA